ncbi:MAG: AgmX/PglI C-terminal domain-containing protein [Bdellovibrionales bacterium]
MSKSSLVIENSNGQVVRTLAWHESRLVAYMNHDTHRVEIVNSIDELADTDFTYTVLAEGLRKDLENKPMRLSDRGTIRLVSHIDETVDLVELKNDNTDELKTISKWTAIGHGILALLLLIGSFIMGRLEPEIPEMVTVFHQERPEVKKTVKMSEKKIVRPTFKAKVSNRTVKPKYQTTRSVKKVSRIRTQVNVNKVGALGALGGMTNGKKGSAGFNINATNSSLGTSLKDVGAGGAGGFERAIHGKGLIAGAVGTGGHTGSGGYATRGKGGGRPGYGTMSMVGGSNGYFLPLEEEALIEGGLDKDQIAAVIQRHLGEIIYCYEKGLQVQPSLNGRVGVAFVINGGGRVATSRIDQSSLRSSKVESCILGKLRNWKFPQPVGGVNVKVNYPFVLRRAG